MAGRERMDTVDVGHEGERGGRRREREGRWRRDEIYVCRYRTSSSPRLMYAKAKRDKQMGPEPGEAKLGVYNWC